MRVVLDLKQRSAAVYQDLHTEMRERGFQKLWQIIQAKYWERKRNLLKSCNSSVTCFLE